VLLKGELWPISKAGIDVQIKKYKAVLSNPSCVSTTTAKDYEEAVDFMLDACKKSSTNYALMKSTYRSNFSYICGKWKREFA